MHFCQVLPIVGRTCSVIVDLLYFTLVKFWPLLVRLVQSLYIAILLSQVLAVVGQTCSVIVDLLLFVLVSSGRCWSSLFGLWTHTNNFESSTGRCWSDLFGHCRPRRLYNLESSSGRCWSGLFGRCRPILFLFFVYAT